MAEAQKSKPPKARTRTLERDFRFRKVASSRRLHGDIARMIGTDIVGGVYEPGTVLPGEIAFSGELSVSRAAYREAIRILASKGLVSSKPKTGTQVLPRSRWNLLDTDVIEWIFSGGQPNEAVLRDLFELRMIVEPAAAALAADRRTDADIAQMQDALGQMRQHTLTSTDGRRADRLFHETILRATGNDVLQSLSSGICAAVLWTTVLKYRVRDLPRDPIDDHKQVYDAIVAQDGDWARLAMTRLVRLALQDTRNSL